MRKGLKGQRGVKRPVRVVCVLFVFSVLSPLFAQPGYTTHAGNVIAGWPVKLTQTQVTLGHGGVIDPALPSASGVGPNTLGHGGVIDPALPSASGVGSNTLGHGGVIDPALPSASGVGSNTLGRAGSTIPPRGETYPLSIFPESEQRRIAADFGTPRVPLAVKRAIAGAEKAMARSRKRAEKGLCTKEESEAFCAKSAAALKAYLDKQVESGTITPAERRGLERSQKI